MSSTSVINIGHVVALNYDKTILNHSCFDRYFPSAVSSIVPTQEYDDIAPRGVVIAVATKANQRAVRSLKPAFSNKTYVTMPSGNSCKTMPTAVTAPV
jgi:hypothetical protein